MAFTGWAAWAAGRAAGAAERAATDADKSVSAAVKAAEAAEKTAAMGELQIRAWVPVTGIRFIRPLSTDDPMMVEVIYENLGATPALDSAHENQVLMIRGGKDVLSTLPPVERQPGASRGFLMKGDPGSARTEAGPFTAADLKAFSEGRATVVIRGWIEYRDVFDKQHITRYCYHVDADTIAMGHAYTVSPTGNEMT